MINNITLKFSVAIAIILFSGGSIATAPSYYSEEYQFDGTRYSTYSAPHSVATIYEKNNKGAHDFGDAPDFIRRSVSFSDSPAPFVLASVSAYRTTGGGTYISGAQMSYDLSVSGPASTWVPISFNGNYSFSGHDLGGLTNSLSGSAASVSFVLYDNAVIAGGSSFSSFNYSCSQRKCLSTLSSSANSSSILSETSQSYDYREGFFHGVTRVLTNSAGIATSRVYLTSSAGSVLSGSKDINSAYAFIDPEFHIESAWLIQNPGATLSLPLGIGNAVSSVPEQGTWLFLSVGFPILFVRSRKSRSAA